jgi:hypothetical protein
MACTAAVKRLDTGLVKALKVMSCDNYRSQVAPKYINYSV